MKFPHSFGFLVIGLVMFKLPEFAPGLCPRDVFGQSVRATWLHVMGLVQLALGLSFVARGALAQAAVWLERWPEEIAAAMSGTTPRPEDPVPAVATVQLVEVVPADFNQPAWPEQQRAA
jgi:hypothetical protein